MTRVAPSPATPPPVPAPPAQPGTLDSRDVLALGLLVLAAGFVWLRDSRWFADAADVLPVLAALPLAVWLGAPWRWNLRRQPPAGGRLALALAVFAAGLLLDLTLLLALGWTLAAWAWLRTRIPDADRPRISRLLPLMLVAFPWVTLDLQPLGWWFRLSGAATAHGLFSLAGLAVTREGTQLVVQDMPIAVDPSCAGLNALQSLFVAGTFLACVMLRDSSPIRFAANLALLLPLAWLANTLRIVAISAAALTWGQPFAMGLFHTWGGLLVLVVMFAACWLCFRWQTPSPTPTPTPTHASPSAAPGPASPPKPTP